jgi:hypothetical protein
MVVLGSRVATQTRRTAMGRMRGVRGEVEVGGQVRTMA